MEKITAELYQKEPNRYIVKSGLEDGAPTCSFGNKQKWVGYDVKEKKFVRFTKSVFMKLVERAENQL